MTAAVWPPALPAQPGLLMTDTTGVESWVAPPSAAPGFVYWNGTTFVTGSAAPSAGGALTLIQKITTSGSQATATFSSIPAGYTALEFWIAGRFTTAAVDDENLWMLVNGDTTAANYFDTQNSGAKSAGAVITVIAPTTKGVVIGQLPGTLSNANAFGQSRVSILLYDSTIFQKGFMSLSGERYNVAANQVFVVSRFAGWASLSAINSVTFTPGSGNFLDGTVLAVYGVT